MKYHSLTLMSLLFIAASCFVSPLVAQSQGTLYVSNLGETSYNGGPFDYGETTTYGLSAGFVTGSNSTGYTLDSIQLLMGNSELGPGTFNVAIYSDDNGQLGTSLGFLSGSPSPYTEGTYTYTSTGIELSASTAYLLVVSSDSPYIWYDTTSPNYQSSDGWSEIEGTDGRQLQFGIDADPLAISSVPEPSVISLAGISGLIAVFLFRKR
jgi:hypothetical protein